MMIAAVPAFAADGLVINGGAAATNNPNVTLAVQPPDAAAFVEVSFDETFPVQTTNRLPVASEIGVPIPTTGPEERSVRFWVQLTKQF